MREFVPVSRNEKSARSLNHQIFLDSRSGLPKLLYSLVPAKARSPKFAARAKPRYWDRIVAMLDAWTDTPHGPWQSARC
ncbi:MAG: hypothetical protein DLM68_06805 [Hyphomicrobiales bacterium]|nr:MAG: hypothetical protein DLM68_06805 [Hyphomicrobiales bacterium]